MNQTYWDKARSFHGHECPGLAIGVKACEAAVEKMGVSPSFDEELVCITENDACGVDAIQALMGCSIGKGNLLYRGTGKMVFHFFDRVSGNSLRVYLKAQNSGMEREAFMRYLLDAPVDEIFDCAPSPLPLPSKAGRFPSLLCEVCGEAAPEHKMRLQGGKRVCLDCFTEYNRGW